MKCKCPKCGHKWEEPSVNQQAGGKARWRGTKKKERSEAASKAAKARWDRHRKNSENVKDTREAGATE